LFSCENMNLLPYDKFEFKVTLPPWDVCRRLVENVSEETFWGELFSTSESKPFKGDVQEASFKIRRRIWYRNSFLPILHGEMETIADGTRIKIRMKLHLFTQIFLIAWISAVVFSDFLGDGDYMMGFVFLIFAALLTYLGFWFEVKKSRLALLSIFEDVFTIANHGGVADAVNDAAPHNP